jgi:hypothetical protein
MFMVSIIAYQDDFFPFFLSLYLFGVEYRAYQRTKINQGNGT